ncbi:hypothetical protein BJ165DRAFT_1533992 [Panaeolus papilionaceus]|nr:hypothetical protein BJ165DRAFT_1533992 [Panaeolus papilionaceus]
MDNSSQPAQPILLTWERLRSSLVNDMKKNHPTYEPGHTKTAHSCRTASNMAEQAISNNLDICLASLSSPVASQSGTLAIHYDHSKDSKLDEVKIEHLPFREHFRTTMQVVNSLEDVANLPLRQWMDDGVEATTQDWICSPPTRPLYHILRFLQLYFIRELISAGVAVNSNAIDSICQIQIYDAPHPSSSQCSMDKIIGVRRHEKWDVVTLIEFKRWSLAISPPGRSVIDIIDDAVADETSFHKWKTFLEHHANCRRKKSSETAHATVAQAFEQLCNDAQRYILSPGARLLLTGVYGHQHHVVYDRTERKLLWSENLASESLKVAATNEELRKSPEVNKDILDYFFNALFKDMQQAIDRWRNATPKPDSSAHAMSFTTPLLLKSVRTMLPGFYAPFLVMAFHLTFSVRSDVMNPLHVETSWPRLPMIPLYLNLRVHWIGNSVVWRDTETDVVFKQFFTADQYKRELGFYRRLAHLPWIPTVLGTVSTAGRWGIFTLFAGRPIQEDEWEEVVPALECWVKELHRLGIHHHDLACRNVLKGPNGSLTLIDFDSAVESGQCNLLECPDLDVDTPLD